MNFDFNRQTMSMALRFYARALSFPYDELIHELHHLFREIEKTIDTDFDNTVASRILDVINFYQGEEMSALHVEYARLFSYVRDEEPLIQIQLSQLNANIDQGRLMDEIATSTSILGVDEAEDAVPNILDLFSSYIEMEDEQYIESFFDLFIANGIPVFCEQLYQVTNLNFYKEIAKGLNELVFLLKE
jgi:nitrate reductase assembly molybdenum cofactor insertion protein NarJ